MIEQICDLIARSAGRAEALNQRNEQIQRRALQERRRQAKATIDGEVQAGGSASFTSRIARAKNVGTELISAAALGS